MDVPAAFVDHGVPGVVVDIRAIRFLEPEWLDLEHGERPSSSQAASWLDVKRTYMQLRPNLRRIYTVVEQPATYLPVVLRLGFRPLGDEDGVADLGSHRFTSVALDFGPGSVDGWLAGLVAVELGLDPDVGVDQVGREVSVNGKAVQLTWLEFGVLRCLQEHEGKTVSRATILEAAWGYESDVGSNVVDVVGAPTAPQARWRTNVDRGNSRGGIPAHHPLTVPTGRTWGWRGSAPLPESLRIERTGRPARGEA